MLIDNSIKNDKYYCIAKLHEYIHLNEFIGDERLVSYKTFETLVKSNDAYLNKCGYYLAILFLSGSLDVEYDCSYYIIEYLQNNLEISENSCEI